MNDGSIQRRSRKLDEPQYSIWASGGTWLALFAIASAFLAWGILSLPFNGVVRGMILLFAIIGVAVACGAGWFGWLSKSSLPALDRTPLDARVREVRGVSGEDSPDDRDEAEARMILVSYAGVDGQVYTAWIGDLIHESSIDRFAPGSYCQVYAFQDPRLGGSTVFLTEAHNGVWRSGTMLSEVHGTGQVLSYQQPAPGSPFLDENSRWRFA